MLSPQTLPKPILSLVVSLSICPSTLIFFPPHCGVLASFFSVLLWLLSYLSPFYISGILTRWCGFDWEGIFWLCLLCFSLSLSSGNRCVHKCQWGGGIPQSVIRMNAPTHTYTLIHRCIQKYTPVLNNFDVLRHQQRLRHTAHKEKTLCWNIIWIPIHLSSCFSEFPHNRGNSLFCLWRCMHTKCGIHVSYTLSGRLNLCVREEEMLLCKILVCLQVLVFVRRRENASVFSSSSAFELLLSQGSICL